MLYVIQITVMHVQSYDKYHTLLVLSYIHFYTGSLLCMICILSVAHLVKLNIGDSTSEV